jgi:hypothetical protein
MPAHGFITDGAATEFLTESLTPYGHFTTAVCSYDGAAIDDRGDVGLGELPATPLSNTG